MLRSPSSPIRATARLHRRALLLAVAALALGQPLLAGSASYRPPLHQRIGRALFPRPNSGYIPVVGSPALRVGEAPPPAPIAPPPVVLYAPTAPPAPAATQPEVAVVAPPAQPPPATPEAATKPTQLRPEDFLPYFQLDDGSTHRATAEGLQFTPARPALPTSRAEYRQQ
jgi:hypothetical protein